MRGRTEKLCTPPLSNRLGFADHRLESMEFPYGHHSHTHHRRNSDSDEDDRERSRGRDSPPPPPFGFDHPPPPRPFFGGGQFPSPPPPNVYGHHSNFPPSEPFPPPPQGLSSGYPPHHPSFPSQHQQPDSYSDYPPTHQPPASVQHVSYESEVTETHDSYNRPHLPSFLHHHTSSHQSNADADSAAVVAGGGGWAAPDFSNKPTFKIFCKAEPNYCLTIRDEKIILARSDPTDSHQQWCKDEKFSTRVKDEEGFPCFSLVNKATGQAVKQSLGASHPVELAAYSWERPDQTLLWTEGKDLGDGYKAVRMVNNVHLNLDAFHGDKKSGGVHDGTIVVLWKWNKGDNQRWKILPY